MLERLAELEIRVLTHFSDLGLRLKHSKCVFQETSVRYLGHIVSGEYLQPLPERVVALLNAPAPHDVTTLQAFLDKLNFYDRFLPDRATIFAPLYHLLRQGAEFRWGPEQQAAFDAARKPLCSNDVVTQYSLDRPLILSVDSSPYGTGAVMAHVMEDGSERPVAYVSRRSSDTETRFSQFDRGLRGVIHAVNRPQAYLSGRRFHSYMENKPAVQLLKRRIPDVASPRILRWLVQLGGYDFSVSAGRGRDMPTRICSVVSLTGPIRYRSQRIISTRRSREP